MKKKIGYREAFSFLIRLCRPMGKEQRTFWFGSLLEALEMLNTLLIPFVFQQMIQLVSGAGEGVIWFLGCLWKPDADFDGLQGVQAVRKADGIQ